MLAILGNLIGLRIQGLVKTISRRTSRQSQSLVLEKDLESAKNKKEKYKSLALKARQVLRDEYASSSDSNDEEYAMAIRDFKTFFRRRGKFVRQPYADKKNFRKAKEDKKEDRRCFKCGDPNHFISDFPNNSFNDEKAFVVGCCSDNGDEKEEICLMAHKNEEGIDFDETYAPVERLESIRILLAYACAHDFKLFQMDVKNNTLFTKKRNSHIIIVQIYVDDIIFGSTCQELCDDFLKIMHDEFEMSIMGELNFFLGLQIKQLKDRIFFNQSKYVKQMLKKFSLEDFKPIKTPMSSETKLTRDEDGEPIDDTKYRGMIGSLLYLTASRLDIMFRACLCARFQESQKTSHLKAVKRIFRYIKGTSHLGLWYPKGTGLETIFYIDSDHAGDYVNRKSTSGECTFMGCCLTSWFSKKQTTLAISTTEAEYVSAEKACQQALWMKQALVYYDIKLDDIFVLCDNKGAIDLINLWIRNIVIKKRVEDLQLEIESYQTKLNLTQPDWDASDFLFKEDYTILSKPWAVIYKDRNDQKKMMRETEVYKFSDGTLNRILEKRDQMVKDFKLYEYNPGIETRI
nr:hypothetical protein [Tanacetum cinerariifolium]